MEAIIILLLGWSQIVIKRFSLKELENIFSIERINKSPSVFDMAKLRWFNGEYLRAMTLETFHELHCHGLKKD